MISVKEKEIDGAKYTVTQMTARRALQMQAKIMKLIGPSIGEAISASGGEASFGKAIGTLAATLDEKTFDSFILELLNGVRKNGMELKESTIDLEFAGALNTLFKVLAFVLEANYADFFSEGGILKEVWQAVALSMMSHQVTPPESPIDYTKI